LDCQNGKRFGLPTGEEAPQGLRGWGVGLDGVKGKVSPCGVWGKAPGLCHAVA